MAGDNRTDQGISDKVGLGAFLVGGVTIAVVGWFVAPAFSASFCGLFVDSADPVGSMSSMAAVSGEGRDTTDWALNQVGMCIDANLLAGRSASFPSTFAWAFISMMVGLLGGLTALAGRVWPAARRRVPHALNEVVAGGSLGLALLALSSMVGSRYAAGVGVGLVFFCLVFMWILRQPYWLAVVLALLLVIGLVAALLAQTSSAVDAWDHARVVFLVLTLLAAAALVTAKACAELREWWDGRDRQARARSAV